MYGPFGTKCGCKAQLKETVHKRNTGFLNLSNFLICVDFNSPAGCGIPTHLKIAKDEKHSLKT